MTKEEYSQFGCMLCGFSVTTKTDEELMEYVKAHAAKAHDMKEVRPEMEKAIRERIKSVSVDLPEKPPTESILTSRQNFKFR